MATNFYHQVATAPRIAASNSVRAAQFARAAHQATVDPFQAAAAIYQLGAHQPGPSAQVPTNPYQSLNSPAKHVVPMVAAQAQGTVQFQPSLLTAQSYVPVSAVAVQWPQPQPSAPVVTGSSNRQQIFVGPAIPSWQNYPSAAVAQRAALAAIQSQQQQGVLADETWSKSFVLERTAAMLQAAAPESAAIIPMTELPTNAASEAAYYDLARGAGTDRGIMSGGQQLTGSWGMVTAPAQPAHQPSLHTHQTHHFRQPLPAHGATLLAAIPSSQRRQTLATSAAAAAMAMAAYAGSQGNPVANGYGGSGGHNLNCEPVGSGGSRHHLIGAGNTINYNVARPTRTKDTSSSQLSPVKKRVKESSPPKWTTDTMNTNNSSSRPYLESGYVSVMLNSPSMNFDIETDLSGRSGKSVVILKNNPYGPNIFSRYVRYYL